MTSHSVSRCGIAVAVAVAGLIGKSAAAGPTVTLTRQPNSLIRLNISGLTQSTRYDVRRSWDLKNWTVVGSIIGDSSSTSFDDISGGAATAGFYMVAESLSSSNPSQEIWIAVRNDGQSGTGTGVDPFDGGTAEKFDAILYSYYFTPNLAVHLMGAGPFRTDVNHRWNVRPGWVIAGDGMFMTTVQLVGSLAGWPGVAVLGSDPNIATDNVTIRDLTIDCNWPALAPTASDGLNGEKNSGASAVILSGSNNLLERVRSINSYGSWENHKEAFVLFLTGPRDGDGINNVISQCRAEQPWGTYGNPFALSGWKFSTPSHLITNSKVIGCTAIGRQSGRSDGFSSGGANLANVKNCVVDSNTFIDCYGAAYIDVGQLDGLQVTNNTVIRGWVGVGLRCPDLKQNILISGNNLNIQNRFPTNASCGIFMDTGVSSDVTVSNNTITLDSSGTGLKAFWGIAGWSLNRATISNNTISVVDCELDNIAIGIGVTLLNNRMSDGSPVSFLAK